MCWQIQSLVNLVEDGVTTSLLLKTRSLPCRSRGVVITTMLLAGSAPGEKLVEIFTCCRYGPDWAPWREINSLSPKIGNEATLDLGLDANLKITAVTGNTYNKHGNTWMLEAQLSDGSSWGPHGTTDLDPGESKRPSPSSAPLVLSHLSGDTTRNTKILRFHWRPQ